MEIAEEKLRLMSLLFGAVWAFFFTFMATLLAVLFVMAVYWDTDYRLHAVVILLLIFSVSAGISWLMIFSKLKAKPPVFEASLAEFYKDRNQLNLP